MGCVNPKERLSEIENQTFAPPPPTNHKQQTLPYYNKLPNHQLPEKKQKNPQKDLKQPSELSSPRDSQIRAKNRILQIPRETMKIIEQRHREQRTQNKFKTVYQEDIYETKPIDQNVVYDDEHSFGGEVLYQVNDRDFKADKFHSYIGSLLTYNPLNRTKEIKGTAVLIASDLILTVAHNFYDRLNDVQNVDGKFYLGLNGKLGKYYEIQSFFYPQQFQVLQSADCDYAVAKLKTKVTEIKETNFLTLGFGFNDKKASLNIFGYPADQNYKVVDKSGNREAFQKGLCREQLRSIENNIISYKISTLGGQSGCPIITGQNKNMIIGVHKAGAKDKKQIYNVGRYVNIDMILRMEIWRQKCRAEKFKVIDLTSMMQMDLHSHLFKELKQMYKNQQRKMARMKKIFDHNIQSKQLQMQELQKRIQEAGGFGQLDAHSIIKQNKSLKSRLYEQQTQLKKVTLQAMQLQNLNKNFKKQLNNYKEELSSMIPTTQHSEIVKNFTKKISHLETTLQTKQEEIKVTKEQLDNVINKVNPAHVIEWDPKSPFADKFKIDNARISMRYDDAIYQIVSKKPFPKNRKTIVVFKMLKYGGKYEIGLGIICQSRKQAQISGRHQGSVGYFTRKQKQHGFIYIDGVMKKKESSDFFIPQEGEMQMVVDLIKYQVTFTNRKEEGRFYRLELGDHYKKEQIFAFTQMYCHKDMIMTIT